MEKIGVTAIEIDLYENCDKYFVYLRKPDVREGVLYTTDEFDTKDEAVRFYDKMQNPEKARAYLERYGSGLRY